MRTLMLIVAAWASSGCTATIVGLQLQRAADSLEAVEARGGDSAAPYETTLARQYLEKAREEAGSSELGIADTLARQSVIWSERALAFIDKGARPGIRVDDLQDRGPADAPPPDDDDDDLPDLDLEES